MGTNLLTNWFRSNKFQMFTEEVFSGLGRSSTILHAFGFFCIMYHVSSFASVIFHILHHDSNHCWTGGRGVTRSRSRNRWTCISLRSSSATWTYNVFLSDWLNAICCVPPHLWSLLMHLWLNLLCEPSNRTNGQLTSPRDILSFLPRWICELPH